MGQTADVYFVSGHEYRNGKHSTDLCKLCIAITDEQVEASSCNSENCDLCRAEAELPVGDDPKTEN